jgi:hypothetical protein
MELIGLTAALSVLELAAAVTALALVCAERVPLRALATPYGFAALIAGLTAADYLEPVPLWSRVVAVLALLIALEAAAIAFATPKSLAAYASPGEPLGEPRWWPEFERALRAHASRPIRELNPLRTAVMRSRDEDPGTYAAEDWEKRP